MQKEEMKVPEGKWVGIDEESFAPYRKWKTPYGYLCGTYAAAVLLAYYQDHIDETILSSEIREKNSAGNARLIAQLRCKIQPAGLPTIPLQVSHGINRFLANSTSKRRTRTTALGSWERVTKRLKQKKPVMIGVLGWLGSTYGNHWVVAYAYLEAEDGRRYYKIHDNWGNYRKVIPASWANGTVSFP
ncbi:MAG: C39 family peptidase [Enterococcus sp.]